LKVLTIQDFNLKSPSVYAHMHVNRKMRPIETIPGIGGREDKGE
jgi:hypothetical protein